MQGKCSMPHFAMEPCTPTSSAITWAVSSQGPAPPTRERSPLRIQSRQDASLPSYDLKDLSIGIAVYRSGTVSPPFSSLTVITCKLAVFSYSCYSCGDYGIAFDKACSEMSTTIRDFVIREDEAVITKHASFSSCDQHKELTKAE